LASHGAGPIPSTVTASNDRPRQIYEFRPDLRAAYPHALLPPGRRAFFDWLFTHGRSEYGLASEEIVTLLVELDRDPSHGLADTFRLTPQWQQVVPHGLTPAGWPNLIRFIRETETFDGPWLAAAAPPATLPRSGGLNIIGHFRHPCGVGELAARFADGLEQLGMPVSRRDVPTFALTPPWSGPRPLGLEEHDVSAFWFGATVDVREAYRRAGLHPRSGVYRVAGWLWELDTFPPEAARQLDFVDEIWAPSRFVAAGAQKVAGGLPIRVIPPSVPTPMAPPNPRARFGIDPNVFVVLFTFDAGSVFERKNPFALVRAVRAAFRSDDRVELVMKVSNPAAAPEEMARLRDDVRKLGGRIIEGTLPRSETNALLAACDCYASLHRAEGFGLTLAEAMLLGKPTVATGYSANLDFMTPQNSYLVSHRLVELNSAIGPYPAGAAWADPDVGHAAGKLRFIFDHRDEARHVGLRAKQDLEPLLDPTAAARRISRRLAEIHALLGKAAA
jgi:glycosyltransferase involved in cell wall biosynthesis